MIVLIKTDRFSDVAKVFTGFKDNLEAEAAMLAQAGLCDMTLYEAEDITSHNEFDTLDFHFQIVETREYSE